jgi:dihydrofolate reductase
MEALAAARLLAKTLAVDEIVVGGGAEIFLALLDETQRIELTEIALEPEGDVFFPKLNMAQWREIKRETPSRGERDEADLAFVTLARR